MPSLIPKTYETSSGFGGGLVEINQEPNQFGFGEASSLYGPLFTERQIIIGSFTLYGATSVATKSVKVLDYNNHSFQAFTTGANVVQCTGSFNVYSSVDGYNFVPIWTFTGAGNTSSMFSFSGRRHTIRATFSGSGNQTASLYIVSGQ